MGKPVTKVTKAKKEEAAEKDTSVAEVKKALASKDIAKPTVAAKGKAKPVVKAKEKETAAES